MFVCDVLNIDFVFRFFNSALPNVRFLAFSLTKPPRKNNILNGKLYRCPFSANATNIEAIPLNKSDYVNLETDNKNIEEIRKDIIKLYTKKQYLTACSYCNGRDYTTPIIKAAIQTKSVIKIPELTRS